MKKYAKIYSLYTSNLTWGLRVFLFMILIYLSSYLFLQNSPFLKFPLSLLGLLIMEEIFFYFHIYRKEPITTVLKNDGSDIYSSFTLNALRSLSKDGINLEQALKEKPVKFMLEKAEITKEEVKKINLNQDDLAKYTFELVKQTNREYVASYDIFAAYLLLTEDQTKLLFNKEIKKEEFMDILLWARRTFPRFNKEGKIRVNFYGEGIAEDWVSGWTIETKKYTIDKTAEIANWNFNLYDRESEYKRLIEGLSANKSILIVGEPGVGKKALFPNLLWIALLESYP
jgi:ATP-dependent Clp protease ATP-binding subunit ClpA